MLKRLWIKIKYSLWLKPALISFAAFVLAIFSGLLDSGIWFSLTDTVPWFFLTGIGLAQTILGVTSAALLSMTVFTFSTTMVVLTTYSSQYSPRVVRNFLTDDKTVATLGIFMAGFVYSITALSFMKIGLNDQPVLSANFGIMLTILCLVQFLRYVNHVSAYIQVKNLIQRLEDQAIRCIQDYRERIDQGVISRRYSPPAYLRPLHLKANKNGYIRLIDYKGIARKARELDCSVCLSKIPGVFVTTESTLLIIYHNTYSESEDDQKKFAEKIEIFRSSITIGNEQLEDQDFIFSIQKINDITLRAISPGVNDPNTAIHCLKMTGILLADLADLEHGWLLVRKDNDKTKSRNPVIAAFELIDFEKILYLVFVQVVHYGKQDVLVMQAVIKALSFIMERASEDNQKNIVSFFEYVWTKLPESLLQGIDGELLEAEKADCLQKASH